MVEPIMILSITFHDTAYTSGWLLGAMVLFLAAYGVRKKLTYPPLLRSATWLNWHVHVGIICIVVFFIHSGLRLPNGLFETCLSAAFLILAGSGIIGIILSRTIPSRLSVRGEEVIFERIPMFRRELRKRAEQLAVDSVEKGKTTTLADFYASHLVDFFRGPRNSWRHLAQSSRPLNRLNRELRAIDRYLNDEERGMAVELAELIRAKDTLDYHRVMQGVLKIFFFVHVPLTYILLIFVAFHVMLVHAFRGTG
jgi:hypothetical protein